ncbi:MAG: AAA family ATPase [Clostridiales bacterium]|nr:AAA family ATPase [Clostridiales bacterium]
MSLLKIDDGVLFGDEAKEYLRLRAAENEARAGKRLTGQIEEGESYSKADLRTIFESWYDGYLKRNVYPQYQKSGAKFMRKAERGPQGAGVEKLRELIGLSEAKKLVENILDFAKVQQLYSFDGARKKQTLHMTFSGNPGTAKTTVARIVARVLKENGVLRNGSLIEVGRADLVGKYVGWTAVQVRQAFDRASGSVLFIDEAYSLIDSSQTFGDEAINTIVQEMENRREDVVVIFAGYPEKMEQFLRKNPGLRSRIGFHVHFPDYSVAELYEILEFTAKAEGMLLSEEVHEKVLPIMEKASREKEFGNGRYVRNLIEHARMRQAGRLLAMDAVVTETDAVTLVSDDFEELRLSESDKLDGRIGFL